MLASVYAADLHEVRDVWALRELYSGTSRLPLHRAFCRCVSPRVARESEGSQLSEFAGQAFPACTGWRVFPSPSTSSSPITAHGNKPSTLVAFITIGSYFWPGDGKREKGTFMLPVLKSFVNLTARGHLHFASLVNTKHESRRSGQRETKSRWHWLFEIYVCTHKM